MVGTVLFCDVGKVSRATSAMMDVPIDEQELPEPVKLMHYLIINSRFITTAFFCDVRKFVRATSAMMDVPTCRQTSRSCQNLLS